MKATSQDAAADIGMRQEMDARMQARIRAVEQEAQRLRRTVRALSLALFAGAALGLGFGAWKGAFSDGTPGVVQATRIVLVTEDGRPRGEWFVDPEGSARFSLMDREERERLLLTVRNGGYPGISLANAAGQRRVALGLLPDETTSLVFADGGGIPRAILGLTGRESANLVFADREGMSRVGLGLDANGVGSVLLPEDAETLEEAADPDALGSDR